jgi:glucosamine 6-phosphate synthetase-like amidotransferase/phosphosugar isomerase protein
LVGALKRLEYRGYDSAGIATLIDGRIERRRAEGKLSNLVARLEKEPVRGTIGIGHTRWATHGQPIEKNAHPIATDKVAVVHNGIIENFQALKKELAGLGHSFHTDTDTEAVANLVTHYLSQGLDPTQAVARTLERLDGAFALVFLFAGRHDLLICARRGSPLAIGYGDGEMFVGSDALALAPLTRQIAYLDEGDWAVVTSKQVQIYDRANNPVEADIASEFRYRAPAMPRDGAAIIISQSGETADTLAALRYCREAGQKIIAIVNQPESTIARESDVILPTLAGPEIGVASTKAFTTQLAVLAAFTIAMARARGTIDAAEEARLAGQLAEVPSRAAEVLHHDEAIQEIAAEVALARDVLYLGRGTSYPLALEGALKLKEISYIHAEGYAAGEMKHGPIALIDDNVPVVVVAPPDALFEKTFSNIEEVCARGGKVVMISDSAGIARIGERCAFGIPVPHCAPFVAPLLYTIPVQLLAYHTAVLKGTDVDQPRNLAKSVTVE